MSTDMSVSPQEREPLLGLHVQQQMKETASVAKVQNAIVPLDDKVVKTAEPVFKDLVFKRDYKADKEYYTWLSHAADWMKDSESPLGVLAGIVTACILPLIFFCIAAYGQRKAANVIVYNEPQTWESLRKEAATMDFKQIVQKHGLWAIRRYAIIDNTVLQQKFNEWLKSDEVVARKWRTKEGHSFPFSSFTSVDALASKKVISEETWTSWKKLSAPTSYQVSEILKREKAIDNALSIPPNQKVRDVVGRQMQHMTQYDFSTDLSLKDLTSEGVFTMEEYVECEPLYKRASKLYYFADATKFDAFKAKILASLSS